MTADIYPWHQEQWRDIERRLSGGRMPHALLISGPEGLGKFDFACQLASRLLCRQANAKKPCGTCKNCLLFQSGSHPDFRRVTVEEEKSQISIDQLRDLTAYLSLTAQSATYKLAVIYPAEAMNQHAANSLLKTLEEPAANSILMLVSHQPGRLAPTIRSRCQFLAFKRPDSKMAGSWLHSMLGPSVDTTQLLSMAGGLPLKAMALAQHDAEIFEKRNNIINDIIGIVNGEVDPVKSAARWLKLDPKTSLYYLYGWLTDMARLSFCSLPPYLAHPDMKETLSRLAEKLEAAEIFRHLDSTRRAITALETTLNVQLLLEDVLIPWRYGFK